MTFVGSKLLMSRRAFSFVCRETLSWVEVANVASRRAFSFVGRETLIIQGLGASGVDAARWIAGGSCACSTLSMIAIAAADASKGKGRSGYSVARVSQSVRCESKSEVGMRFQVSFPLAPKI